jgi:site-specific DNA-methyltransferase (cytosine-N4-specific)
MVRPLVQGCKPKDLIGAPWLLAFALRADGWYLRQCIIWHKPNPMPESVRDRCTTAHSYLFLLSKSPRYWFDAEAIAEPASEGTDLGLLRTRSIAGPGADPMHVSWQAPSIAARQAAGVDSRNGNPSAMKNARSVWSIPTEGFAEAHFATWPQALVERIVKAGCPEGGTVLDPFMGSGTTALVARRLGRRAVGVELSAEYAALAARRLQQLSLLAEDAA